MRIVKKYINEKFSEDSDPIKDMEIGKKFVIKNWLDEQGVKNYQINNDLTIDVNENVYLYNQNLVQLPEYIQFNEVNGIFSIKNNNLITLRGCPKITKSYFDCSNNDLTNLDFAPKEISVTLFCKDNNISKEEIAKYVNNLNVNEFIYIDCDMFNGSIPVYQLRITLMNI